MNKQVLITGGAQGLGISLALTFARNNYDIIITYNKSYQNACDLQKKIKDLYKVNVQIFKLDLENDQEINSLFENIDHLNVLINNAAFNEDTPWQDKTRESFLKILNINTVSPFIMSKYAYQLLKRNKGIIINISSTNGIDTMYTESLDYDASKAALNNLTKNLSVAFAPDIRVNGIASGWIDTTNTRDMEESFRKKEEAKILAKRFAKPEEIANLALFLASDESSYINGSIVRIDGGSKYGN